MSEDTPTPNTWITPDIQALLRKDPWFGSVSAELERAVLALGTPRRLQQGEHLFARGDPPDGLYAVLEGGLRISGVTEAGKEAILAIIEPPNWFGEIALFDRLPRTHNAMAEGPTRVMHVPLRGLDALLERSPHFWRHFGVLMALKLRLAFIGMEDLALLPAESRLARRLLMLAHASASDNPGPVTLALSQAQLGMMLSLSRQTTNQVLQSLQDQGAVQVSYGRIEVLDLDKLRAVSGLSPSERHILEHLQHGTRAPSPGQAHG